MLKFATIGTNFITDQFISAAHLGKKMKLTAIYSRCEKTAADFASKHGILNIFTNLDDLACSNDFDAVYIASPNSFHCEQAIKMMQGGKHVFCEKPISSNPKELEKMISVAKQNNVVLFEGLMTVFVPNFQVIRDNISKLGTLRRFSASFCQYSSRYDAFKSGNVLNAFKNEFSNGALMDIGIYLVYPMISLFGKPQKSYCVSTILSTNVDGQGSIIAQYYGANNMIATLNYSKITKSQPFCEIHGEDAIMLIDSIPSPNSVKIVDRKTGKTIDLSVEQNDERMMYEALHFVKLVSGELDYSVDLRTSLLTSKLMEKSRQQVGLAYKADK